MNTLNTTDAGNTIAIKNLNWVPKDLEDLDKVICCVLRDIVVFFYAITFYYLILQISLYRNYKHLGRKID